MSLHSAAQYLQSHGRGNDTMLIHMTPKEVSGLQALAEAHGGSLTTNPSTGLPEAGFLDSILPLIAGIALNAVAPGLGAIGSGLLVGGATGALTGDMSKGLAAGLGAFGGAGLGGALAEFGSAASAAGSEAGSLGADAASAARSGKDISGALANSYTNQAGQQLAQQGAQGTSSILPNLGGAGQRFGQMSQGLSNIYNTPGAGTQFLKNNLLNVGAAASPILSGASLYGNGGPNTTYDPTNPFLKRHLSPGFTGGFATPAYYTPTGLGYASGGGVGRKLSDLPEQRLAPPGMYYGEGRAMDYAHPGMRADEAGRKMMEENFENARIQPLRVRKTTPVALAQGGLGAVGGSSLGSYSDGGRLLKGPGDGMSDNIPATIEGVQPARLGSEEFVVPADVVSHLGNGSSEAGANRLYKMMDEVRKARTGSTKQAPKINADKYL